MDLEQFERTIAERVMGWVRIPPRGDGNGAALYCDIPQLGYVEGDQWHPASDPRDDYMVLCHVREEWGEGQQRKFTEVLENTWCRRCFCLIPSAINYTPGDYSRAALEVLGVAVTASAQQ